MLEGRGGLIAPGAAGGVGVIPSAVGAEIALARPHHVMSARVKPFEAHEGVRLERGAVGVPGRVGGHG